MQKADWGWKAQRLSELTPQVLEMLWGCLQGCPGDPEELNVLNPALHPASAPEVTCLPLAADVKGDAGSKTAVLQTA